MVPYHELLARQNSVQNCEVVYSNCVMYFGLAEER